MIAYSRGDVVLVRFVFSEGAGAKRRPALILSSDEYHSGRHEVVVAAITSNVSRHLFGDHVIGCWEMAGLIFPSTVTAILRTIKRSMVDGRLGSLPQPDLQAFSAQLRRVLVLYPSGSPRPRDLNLSARRGVEGSISSSRKRPSFKVT
jgi:mRNA interferase MazF